MTTHDLRATARVLLAEAAKDVRLNKGSDLWNGWEVNTTRLAEEVSHEFDHDEWLDDETHPVWEIVLAEGTAFERIHNR